MLKKSLIDDPPPAIPIELMGEGDAAIGSDGIGHRSVPCSEEIYDA
jgi:hypothetical protein